MNAGYQIHMRGDCNPYSCLICEQECDVCGEWRGRCTCPQLPLDEEEGDQ